MTKDFWSYEEKPNSNGYYAVLYCWDPHEGVFPGQSQFHDETWVWSSNASIVAFSGPYSSREIAFDLAQANDPDL